MVCFVNDQFVSDAKVPLVDLGVLRGHGVFEFARTYEGNFFHLDVHIDRFFNSAKAIGLQIPYRFCEIEKLCHELVQRNGFINCSVKMILTGGVSQNGFDVEGKPFFALIANELKANSVALSVATARYERYLPECKTLNYLPAILERKEARGKGFDEVLFLDHRNNVLEGARENFFAIKGDMLITPKIGVLQGVTRQCVIDLAKDMMKVEERTIAYEELQDCHEAFFTSTAREIASISKIDSMNFLCTKTLILQKLFRDTISQRFSTASA